MVEWICAGYGLLAGVVFFVYLCWFMHVRDHVEGRGKRILYYFLIAVTFSLVGKFVGISPILGVVPMLILMSFLPKGRISYVVACSLMFGAIWGAVVYGGVVGMMDATDSRSPHRSMELGDPVGGQGVSSSSKFDLDKYFVSASIDPMMEFEEPQEVAVENVTLLFPIPKNYTCTEKTSEHSALRTFYFCERESAIARMIVGIPKTMHFRSDDAKEDLKRAKRDAATAVFVNPALYVEKVTAPLKKKNIPIEDCGLPVFIQNAENGFTSFFSCNYIKENKTFSYSVIENVFIIANRAFEISSVLYGNDKEKDKIFGFTWVSNFQHINNIQ